MQNECLEVGKFHLHSLQHGLASVRGQRYELSLKNHRLEKTSEIMKSSHPLNTTVPAIPYPKAPHLHIWKEKQTNK